MKLITMYILTIYSFVSYSQTSLDYYNKGVIEFQNNNLRKADSLFTLSIEIAPNKDSYFNRGITKKILQDTCRYCMDMDVAYRFYSDTDALINYQRDCLYKADTIFLSNKQSIVNKYSKYRYYDVIMKGKCSNRLTGKIIDTKMKYDVLGAPMTTKASVHNLMLLKTNIFAEYYFEDSLRIYTNFSKKPQLIFTGENKDLILGKIRGILLANQPKLKEIKNIPIYIITVVRQKYTRLK